MRFGPIEDVDKFYAAVEASPAYATAFRPDADAIREAKMESLRKRRVRKPTMGSVWKQAQRAGVPVASLRVNGDGSITIVPGTPNGAGEKLGPVAANEWN